MVILINDRQFGQISKSVATAIEAFLGTNSAQLDSRHKITAHLSENCLEINTTFQ